MVKEKQNKKVKVVFESVKERWNQLLDNIKEFGNANYVIFGSMIYIFVCLVYVGYMSYFGVPISLFASVDLVEVVTLIFSLISNILWISPLFFISIIILIFSFKSYRLIGYFVLIILILFSIKIGGVFAKYKKEYREIPRACLSYELDIKNKLVIVAENKEYIAIKEIDNNGKLMNGVLIKKYSEINCKI